MYEKQKIVWLVSLLFLLFLMISVGGVTRLTRSGLSITEWKPVAGILPPLTEEAWDKEFSLYKKSPEFKQVNSHFDLKEYKQIFWWEFLHRLLGRIIFFVVLIPGFFLWRKKTISGRYVLLLPALIAFQGLMGWLMVKSGLNHRPSVSHYMLATHFFLALTTVAFVYYPLAKLKKPIEMNLSKKSYRWIIGFGVLLLIQLLYGCFTSGLKAGIYFPTFPMMGGQFFPPSGVSHDAFLQNFLINPPTVQWVHRWIGILISICVLGLSYILVRENSKFLRPMVHLVSIVLFQILIGILNILYFVPIPLAATHQFMAVLIFLGYLNVLFRVRPRRA